MSHLVSDVVQTYVDCDVELSHEVSKEDQWHVGSDVEEAHVLSDVELSYIVTDLEKSSQIFL